MSSKSNVINPNEILETWRSRRFTGGIWTDPPGQAWKDYTHDTDE